MSDERRQHTRLAFHAPARLSFSGTTFDVVVLDISLKGALLQLPALTPIAAEAPCRLEVRLRETD